MVGYYWPTLKNDCVEYVNRCDRCQRFVEVSTAPLEQLHSITSPWSFHKWGVDILGPFPPTPSRVKYLIVAVDYFTNWIEAEPIIYRFGIPVEIVFDNGTQFASRSTASFYAQLKIKQRFTSIEHP
ncbi:Gypsy retrotransposon integrase-like protein 1, partial [Mucuna pruriens]